MVINLSLVVIIVCFLCIDDLFVIERKFGEILFTDYDFLADGGFFP